MAKPDDLAVALGHDPERQDLPRVVATGRGAIAARIVAVAEAGGVPVRRDPDLVRVLGALEPGTPIPAAAFAAVAEILARIYRANGRIAAGAGSGGAVVRATGPEGGGAAGGAGAGGRGEAVRWAATGAAGAERERGER